MKTVAETKNGYQTGKVWYNDEIERTSQLIFACDIPEILGMSEDELNEQYGDDLEALNADITDCTFTEEPKY